MRRALTFAAVAAAVAVSSAAAAGPLPGTTTGNGIGDCGIYSVFRFNGSRFVPVVTRAKAACDGESGGGPTRWPKLPLLSP